jgi:hypothetical protein
MKTVKLLSGKTIEIETKNGKVEAFGSFFNLKNINGNYYLCTLGNDEMSRYFGINVTGKWVNLEVSKTTLNTLDSECEVAKQMMTYGNGLTRNQLYSFGNNKNITDSIIND